MTGPVNPILVVKNNLPGYVAELLYERSKLSARIVEIDAQVETAHGLADVVGITFEETMAVTDGE